MKNQRRVNLVVDRKSRDEKIKINETRMNERTRADTGRKVHRGGTAVAADETEIANHPRHHHPRSYAFPQKINTGDSSNTSSKGTLATSRLLPTTTTLRTFPLIPFGPFAAEPSPSLGPAPHSSRQQAGAHDSDQRKMLDPPKENDERPVKRHLFRRRAKGTRDNRNTVCLPLTDSLAAGENDKRGWIAG